MELTDTGSSWSVYSDCDCYLCQLGFDCQRMELESYPYYPAMHQPLVYYAQCRHGKSKDCRECKRPNCFVRAFKWYTNEHKMPRQKGKPCSDECSDPRDSNSDQPNIGAFSAWLDYKYQQFLTENNIQDACRIKLTQTSVIESCKQSPREYYETCGRKRFTVKNQWLRRKQKCQERECPRNMHDQGRKHTNNMSMEFILTPKTLSRAASECCHPTPCCSVDRQIVKSQSATATVSLNKSGIDNQEFVKPPVEQKRADAIQKHSKKYTNASCQCVRAGQSVQTQCESLASKKSSDTEKTTQQRPTESSTQPMKHQSNSIMQVDTELQPQFQEPPDYRNPCPDYQGPCPSLVLSSPKIPCNSVHEPCPGRKPCPSFRKPCPPCPKSDGYHETKLTQEVRASKTNLLYQQNQNYQSGQINKAMQRNPSKATIKSSRHRNNKQHNVINEFSPETHEEYIIIQPCPDFQRPCLNLGQSPNDHVTCPSANESCPSRRPCPSYHQPCPLLCPRRHGCKKNMSQFQEAQLSLGHNQQAILARRESCKDHSRLDSTIQYQQENQMKVQMKYTDVQSNSVNARCSEQGSLFGQPPSKGYSVTTEATNVGFGAPVSDFRDASIGVELCPSPVCPGPCKTCSSFVQGTRDLSRRKNGFDCHCLDCQPSGMNLNNSKCCVRNDTLPPPGPIPQQNIIINATEGRCSSNCPYYATINNNKVETTKTEASQNVQFSQCSSRSIQTSNTAIALDRCNPEYKLYMRVVCADKLKGT